MNEYAPLISRTLKCHRLLEYRVSFGVCDSIWRAAAINRLRTEQFGLTSAGLVCFIL